MTTNLNTLVTALYVKIDDDLAGIVRLPGRPPKLSHSELLCLAVMQAILGFHCEARWLRYVRAHLQDMFPFIPQDASYNKRLRAALPQIKRVILIRTLKVWPVSRRRTVSLACGSRRRCAGEAFGSGAVPSEW